MNNVNHYNYYFFDGFRDWDKEALIAIERFLAQSEPMTGHGVRARIDCFGCLLLEVPWSGQDSEMIDVRSRVIAACEEIREQQGQLQLMEAVRL